MSAATTKQRRTRKAPVEVVPEVAVVEEVPASAPAMRVKLSDLHDMRVAQLEKRALKAEAEVARMSKLYALEKLDRKGIVLGLEKRIEQANKQIEAAENRELIARKRMEHTIGRSLSNVAIDPDTGDVVIPS